MKNVDLTRAEDVGIVARLARYEKKHPGGWLIPDEKKSEIVRSLISQLDGTAVDEHGKPLKVSDRQKLRLLGVLAKLEQAQNQTRRTNADLNEGPDKEEVIELDPVVAQRILEN